MQSISPNLQTGRASWNLELEKTLVDLLHEHNTPEYKGQNGWSSETWNRIVRKFHESHPYVSYTKLQIQEKEKELKREYRMLKEARHQSGVSWNEKRWRIEAEEELWNNLIISFPKIGKFRTKGFPHFDALGELYDGQIAEGTYNFTSAQRSNQPPEEQVDIDPEVSSVEVIFPQSHIREVSVDAQGQGGMQEANHQSSNVPNDQTDQTHQSVAAAPSTSTDKEPKRRRTTGDVAAVMERYIELKTVQIEDAKTESRNLDEYSIKNCVGRLNTMELSKEEKAKALSVFKNPENRELFMCVDLEVALMWLRMEMV